MRALRTAVFCENIGKVLKNRTLKSEICIPPRTPPAAGMSRKMRCTARRMNTQWWDAGVVERGALVRSSRLAVGFVFLALMFYTYVIQSVSLEPRLYIGSTANLKNRLHEHNSGKVRSTRPYRPWRLIYYEAHRTSQLSRRAELFYKTSQGRRQLKKKLGLKESG